MLKLTASTYKVIMFFVNNNCSFRYIFCRCCKTQNNSQRNKRLLIALSCYSSQDLCSSKLRVEASEKACTLNFDNNEVKRKHSLFYWTSLSFLVEKLVIDSFCMLGIYVVRRNKDMLTHTIIQRTR